MSTKRSLKALTNNYDTAGIDNIITGYLPHSIYAFETNTHPNYLKVGDTNRRVEVRLNEWRKIYKDLIKKYEAEAMLEKYISQKIEMPVEFHEVGRMKELLGHKDEAKQYYQKAVEMDKEFSKKE